VLPLDGAWFGVGMMDAGRDKAVCVYVRSRGAADNAAIGRAQGYRLLPATLLIRWGGDPTAAQAAAFDINDALSGPVSLIGGAKCFTRRSFQSPVPLGAGRGGIFEYSADFNFYHEIK
jgi:hypothetical protein